MGKLTDWKFYNKKERENQKENQRSSKSLRYGDMVRAHAWRGQSLRGCRS